MSQCLAVASPGVEDRSPRLQRLLLTRSPAATLQGSGSGWGELSSSQSSASSANGQAMATVQSNSWVRPA